MNIKRKVWGLLIVLALAVAVVVSCQEPVVSEDAVASISFSGLQAETKSLGATVEHKQPSTLYWRYTAEKLDSAGTTGQVYPSGDSPTLADKIAASKPVKGTSDSDWALGLDQAHEFSVGSWEFTLYAFASNKKVPSVSNYSVSNYIYSGSVKTTVTAGKTSSVTVGVLPVSEDSAGAATIGIVDLSNIPYDNTGTYTIKFKITDGTKDLVSSTTRRLIDCAIGNPRVVYVEKYKNNDGTLASTSSIYTTVYRGLETKVQDTVDDTKRITVTFNAGDGSVHPTSKTVTIGGTYGTLPSATKNGYFFDGWYTASEEGNKVTADTEVTSEVNELYAKWTNKGTVTYDGNGNSTGAVPEDTNQYNYNDEVKVLPNSGILEKGSTNFFAGWSTLKGSGTVEYKVGDSFNITENTTLYAVWTDDYQQVEYIQTTGTQYIDTGMKGTEDTAFKIRASTTTVGTRKGVLFGSRSSADSNNITAFLPVNPGAVAINYAVVDFGDYNSTRLSLVINNDDIIECYSNNSQRSIINLTSGGQVSNSKSYSASFITPTKLYIAHKTNGYGESHYNFEGKIYYCKIWEGNVLVRDFIPCKSNSVNGMYDIVNGKFYGNNGTGDFGVGPNV